MRKLNGITINGEYLGNSVVINGMFRAICTISPNIMRDFVQIINKIERLEEAVKIKNFNCGFDNIDIEFENTQSKGIASLYFKLKNGEPELTDCKLVIDNEVYSTFTEKIQLKSQKQEPVRQLTDEEIAKRDRLRELKRQKMEKMRKEEERKQLFNNAVKDILGGKELPKDPVEREKLKKQAALLAKKREAALEKKRAAERKAAQDNNYSSSDGVTQTRSGDDYTDNPSAKSSGRNIPNSSGEYQSDPRSSDNSPYGESDEFDMTNDRTKDLSSGAGESSFSDSELDEFAALSEEFGDTYDEPKSIDDELRELEEEFGDLDNISDSDIDAYSELGGSELDDFMNDEFYSSAMKRKKSDEYTIIAKTIKMEVANMEGMPFAPAQSQGFNQGYDNFNNSGFGSGGNNNFGGGANNNFSSSDGFNFSDTPQGGMTPSAPKLNNAPAPPNFAQIDSMNNDAAMNARSSYTPDEEFDPDDISEIYSDFYDRNQNTDYDDEASGQLVSDGPPTSEVDALNAELEALKSQTAVKKDLMSMEEFMLKQKELAEAREKKRRQRFRIVGSRERINASALDGGVFVSGNKFYKWGDPKLLDQ